MFKKMYSKVAAGAVSVAAFVAPAVSGAVTAWDPISTAADTTGLQTTVVGVLVAMISISLIFVAYKFIKRATNK